MFLKIGYDLFSWIPLNKLNFSKKNVNQPGLIFRR